MACGHPCDCPSYRDHLLTIGVAAAATPTRRRDVIATEAKEAEWSKDHAAYRRLRKDGLQPKKLDGSARIEAHADHALEVEHSTLLRDIKEGT